LDNDQSVITLLRYQLWQVDVVQFFFQFGKNLKMHDDPIPIQLLETVLKICHTQQTYKAANKLPWKLKLVILSDYSKEMYMFTHCFHFQIVYNLHV
jgi:hypothetical protein